MLPRQPHPIATPPLPMSCDWLELHPLFLIGWSSGVWFGPSHFTEFTEPDLCTSTDLLVPTQDAQLAQYEWIFYEFNKKCIGLELMT